MKTAVYPDTPGGLLRLQKINYQRRSFLETIPQLWAKSAIGLTFHLKYFPLGGDITGLLPFIASSTTSATAPSIPSTSRVSSPHCYAPCSPWWPGRVDCMQWYALSRKKNCECVGALLQILYSNRTLIICHIELKSRRRSQRFKLSVLFKFGRGLVDLYLALSLSPQQRFLSRPQHNDFFFYVSLRIHPPFVWFQQQAKSYTSRSLLVTSNCPFKCMIIMGSIQS